MSDSTPENIVRRATRATDPIAASLGRTSPWWVVSAVLHAAAILALLYFSPLRTIIFRTGTTQQFETTAGADRIEEVVEQIRERRAEVLSYEVEELLDIRDRLEEIRDTKLDSYEQLTRQLAQDAPQRALEAQDAALKAQQKALDELDKAASARAKAEKAQADAAQAAAGQAIDEARADQDRARQAQIEADEAQAKAEQMLTMLGSPAAAAREAQAKAIEAQAAADTAGVRAQGDQQTAADRQRQAQQRQEAVPDKAARARDLEAPAAQAEAQAVQREAAAQEAHRLADEAQAAARKAQAEADRLMRESRKTKDAASRAKADEQKKQADGAKVNADAAKKKAGDADKAARDARGEVTRRKRDLDNARAQLQRAADDAKAAQTQAQAAQAAARPTGEKASEAQKKAKEAQEAARAVAAKALADTAALAAAGDKAARPDDNQHRPDLSGRNLAQLYDLAVETEKKSTEAYKQVRAAELAMIREIPLAQAMASTDVAKPLRPELDKDLLLAKVRDLQTAERHKKEVETAVREVESMVELGRRLLDLAGEGQGKSGTELSTDWYRAKGAQQEELTKAAMEDEGAKAKDLAALMKKAMGPETDDGQGDASGAATAGGPQGPPPAAAPAKSGRAAAFSGPPVVRKDLKAIPGRKVVVGGDGAEWMYVDSWYVIGPFPNPNRINRDKKFPPESVVDLDARYVGKLHTVEAGGEKHRTDIVRWEYMKSAEPIVIPPHAEPYAIYYAYTELWFDQPCDLWIAVGSDDKSNLWVEDQPVWVSSNRLKSWQIAEGLRRVHFKRGRNRILYRVENDWQQVAFSLVIQTKPSR